MARGTKGNGAHKGLSYTKFGYIFIAPFCIVYLIFSLYPLLTTFWYSVSNPKSATAKFWGFNDKDVYYDEYLDLSDKSIYTNEEAFTEATGLTYDEYRLIKDYFIVQNAANDFKVIDEENLANIVAIGTADNGNGYSLSQSTIDTLNKAITEKSVAPITENYLNDPLNNVYTDLEQWKATYSDPQAFVKDNMDDIFGVCNAIANPETSEDEGESETVEITKEMILNNEALQGIIDTLAEGEFTAEQQVIIDAIASKIGVDSLEDYFVSVQNGEASVEEASFYYAVKNLSTTNSAYSYMTVVEEKETSVAGVMDIDSGFITNIETYLSTNVWGSTISSLSTFDSMMAYNEGEKDVFADRETILKDLMIIDDAGIMTLTSYVVEGDEVTATSSKSNKLEETITNLNTIIKNGKPSDEKLTKCSDAIYKVMNYYRLCVFSSRNADGSLKTAGDKLDLSACSAVDHANNAGYDIEAYVSYEGKLDLDKYKEYKKLIGLADKLTIEDYERFDSEMKATNKARAEKILATTYQDPEVRDPSVETFNINDKGELYFDVDVRNKGSKDVDIVPGNTIKEQLDYLEPKYNQHLIDDDYIINAPKSEKNDAGISGGEGVDRFDVKNVYKLVYYRVYNAEKQIKNPTGVLKYVSGTQQYIFVGGDNFRSIFVDKTVRDTVAGAFVTTGVMWIMGFVPQILLALILSNWFTDNRLKLKGLGAMKALMYLPNVITAATIAVFFRRVFAYSTGGTFSASQIVVRALTGEGHNFFADPWDSRWIVAFINFWMWYGNTMIVLIAGITSINESLFESAQIDGANSFQTYTKITLPLLRPILLYTLVSSLIGGLQMFDVPANLNSNPAFITFNGTGINSLRTVLMYVNSIAFGAGANKLIGNASAVSVILFIVTTILSILIFYMMRDKDAAKAAKAKKQARKAVK